MFGHLLPLLRLWVTVYHWRHMDSSRTISPSIDYLEIPRKRHVRLRIMTSLTWCYPNLRKHLSLMSLLPALKRTTRFRVASLSRTKWRRNRKNSTFNGLHRVTMLRLSIILWPSINMVLLPNQALLTSGLLLLFGIRGTKTSSQKTSLLPTRFLPLCPNVGIFMPHLPSCSDLHNPWQCLRSRIRRFQNILLGWKPSQPGLLTPPPCPPLQWSVSITSSKRSWDLSATPQLRTIFRMTLP